jgi:hypothetical protein
MTETTAELIAAARARLSQPRAETFRFEAAGDEIAGEVARLDIGDTTYGSVRIVVLRTEDGSLRSVWLIHDALRSQMEKLKPQPGDVIAIQYLGKQVSGNGRSYHAYSVATPKDRPGFTWDAGDGGEENPFSPAESDTPPF